MRLATRGERFSAALVDSLILFAVSVWFLVFEIRKFLSLTEEQVATMMESGQFGGTQFSALPTILYFACYLLIFGWFLRNAQSPGKALLKLRVVERKTGLSISFAWMLVRDIIGKSVSAFLFGFGFWSIFWDKDNQCWHDKVVDTVVIKICDAASRENGPPA